MRSDRPLTSASSSDSSSSNSWLRAWAILGLLCMALGFVQSPARTWANLLLTGFFLLGIGLAGLYFVAIHYAANAGWATAFRRIPEAMMDLVPVGSVMVAVALVGGGRGLYPWMAADQHFAGFKGVWLSPGFYFLRTAIYIAVFCLFALAIRRNSLRQDETGDPALTGRNRAWSAAFLLTGSVALTLASVDWLKVLEPHWFSTMWGVYQFSGLFVAGLAALLLVACRLDTREEVRLSGSHLHDLSKLLFAMATFWMYIWFSQAMLIWYANVSEEVVHYTDRLRLGWGPLMVALVVLKWVVPFFGLVSRRAKSNASLVARISAVVLVAHWLDLMIQIHPPVTGEAPSFGWAETGSLLISLSAVLVIVDRRLQRHSLTPVRDPFLAESLHYHS